MIEEELVDVVVDTVELRCGADDDDEDESVVL
jgi:hypothetical protein